MFLRPTVHVLSSLAVVACTFEMGDISSPSSRQAEPASHSVADRVSFTVDLVCRVLRVFGFPLKGGATRISKPPFSSTLREKSIPLFHLLRTTTKISVEGTFTIVPSYWQQVFILPVCEEGKTVNFAFVQFFSTTNCQMSPQIGAKANTK